MSHAIDRLEERYNLDLRTCDLITIASYVDRGQSIKLPEMQTGKPFQSFHYVKHNGVPIKVLHQKIRNKIITVYPMDVDEYNEAVDQKKKDKIKAKIEKEKECIEYLKKQGYIVYKNWRKKETSKTLDI